MTRPVVLDDWSYLPCPRGAGAVRLVCFPHAGGDVSTFADLAAALGPDVEVLAVRLPGRGGRFADPMPGTFADLVAAVAAGVGPRLGPGAVFYGQSFGALLAYEVARVLGPAAVVAASAPDPAAWAATNGRLAADPAGEAVRLLAESGLDLPDDDMIRELVLSTLRADLTVSGDYRYHPDPMPGFDLHALAGVDDPGAGPLDGWAAATTGPFTSTVLPGGHLLVSPGDAGPADLLRSICQGARSVHHHR